MFTVHVTRIFGSLYIYSIISYIRIHIHIIYYFWLSWNLFIIVCTNISLLYACVNMHTGTMLKNDSFCLAIKMCVIFFSFFFIVGTDDQCEIIFTGLFFIFVGISFLSLLHLIIPMDVRAKFNLL